jgi:26S proteasome regulatory subunit N1
LESDEVDELNEMVGNMHLHESFAFLARELDVEEAKTPEDIYKSHLAEDGGFRRKSSAAATGQQVESARANLVRLCLSNRDLLSTLLIFSFFFLL